MMVNQNLDPKKERNGDILKFRVNLKNCSCSISPNRLTSCLFAKTEIF